MMTLLARKSMLVTCMTGKRPHVSLGCRNTSVEMMMPMLWAMRMLGP